jgi:hypothetical protein
MGRERRFASQVLSNGNVFSPQVRFGPDIWAHTN